MDYKIEEIDRNVEELNQDVKGIKATLTQLGEESKKTSSHLGEILALLRTPSTNYFPRQLLFSPAVHMQSDTASTSSAYSNSTEDDIIRSSGFKTKCMSSSIQSWFWDIIKKIPLEEVNDQALQRGIVTPEDHARFRLPPHKEDGKRLLVSNIMDKSCETMLSFVDIIGKHNHDLQESIRSTFDDRWQMEMARFKEECTLCLIKRRCDLMSVCDFYFTHDLISRDLLNDVIHSSAPERSIYWPRFYAEISKEEGGYALSLMKKYLSENGQFEFHNDIIRRIDRDLKRGKRCFTCRCQASKKRPSHMNRDIDLSPLSTSSMESPRISPREPKRLRHSSVPIRKMTHI